MVHVRPTTNKIRKSYKLDVKIKDEIFHKYMCVVNVIIIIIIIEGFFFLKFKKKKLLSHMIGELKRKREKR